MASVAVEREPDPGPIAASSGDAATIAEIGRLLKDGARTSLLVGVDGVGIELPESLRLVLRRAVEVLAREKAVSIVALDKLLTTQQAANLLNVSRPYLVRLLDEGRIPSTKTGTHRRVRFDDLMAFKIEWRAERRAALTRLTQLNQELGLYEHELRNAPPLDAPTSSDAPAGATDIGTEHP